MRQSSRWLAVAPLVQSSGATLAGDCVAIERSSRFDSGPEPAAVVQQRDQQEDDEPDDAEPAAADRDPAAGKRHPTGAAAVLRPGTGRAVLLFESAPPVSSACAGGPNVESGADGARTRDL